MTQTFLVDHGQLFIETGPRPTPKKGEVLVKIQRAGICGSDLHLFQKGHGLGRPLTLGHEAVGIIAELGIGVDASLLGKRVVVEPNIPCGVCPECSSGFGYVCRNKRIIGVNEDGCFADYAAIPSPFAHLIPEGISENDAVTIEPAAVAYAALRRSEIPVNSSLAVIGLGAIGMLLTHIALALGYRVFVYDPVEGKMEKAIALGATPIADTTETDMEKCLTEHGVSGVFECAGASKTATLAVAIAPRGAKVVLLGLSDSPAQFIPRVLARKGNVIMPSLIYDHPKDFQQTIGMINAGIIGPGFVVEQDYPITELPQALAEALMGKAIKVTLTFTNHD